MVQATCIQKFRDKHNQIYGYRLRDNSGLTRDVKPEALKNAIKAGQIYITNLTLTSDNRLVDTNTGSDKIKQKQEVGLTIEKKIEQGLLHEIGEIENKYKAKYGEPIINAIWHAVNPDFLVNVKDKDSFLEGFESWFYEEDSLDTLKKANLHDGAMNVLYKCYSELWDCLSKYHHLLLKTITDKYRDKYPEELLFAIRRKALTDLYNQDDVELECNYSISDKELEKIENELCDLLTKTKLWVQ